jgi:hypothetical protein
MHGVMFRHQKSRPALFACPYCVSNTPVNPIPKPLTPTSKRIVGLTVLSCNAAQHIPSNNHFPFFPARLSNLVQVPSSWKCILQTRVPWAVWWLIVMTFWVSLASLCDSWGVLPLDDVSGQRLAVRKVDVREIYGFRESYWIFASVILGYLEPG